MPVATATITGPVFDQTGAIPLDATIEFRLRSDSRDLNGAVLRGSTVVKVGPSGSFNAILYSSPKGGSVYDVIQRHRPYIGATMVERDIGPIKVSEGETRYLAALLPVKIADRASDTHRIKRGDTLNIGAVWLDGNGIPIPSAGIGIASALRGPDGVTRSLSATWQAGVGEFELSMSAGSTALLPIGTHNIDIKFSAPTRVVRTLTGRIIVDQEITP